MSREYRFSDETGEINVLIDGESDLAQKIHPNRRIHKFLNLAVAASVIAAGGGVLAARSGRPLDLNTLTDISENLFLLSPQGREGAIKANRNEWYESLDRQGNKTKWHNLVAEGLSEKLVYSAFRIQGVKSPESYSKKEPAITGSGNFLIFKGPDDKLYLGFLTAGHWAEQFTTYPETTRQILFRRPTSFPTSGKVLLSYKDYGISYQHSSDPSDPNQPGVDNALISMPLEPAKILFGDVLDFDRLPKDTDISFEAPNTADSLSSICFQGAGDVEPTLTLDAHISTTEPVASTFQPVMDGTLSSFACSGEVIFNGEGLMVGQAANVVVPNLDPISNLQVLDDITVAMFDRIGEDNFREDFLNASVRDYLRKQVTN
jgi:hypothetical protein